MNKEDSPDVAIDDGLIKERLFWIDRLSGLDERPGLFGESTPLPEGWADDPGQIEWCIDGDLFQRLSTLSRGKAFLMLCAVTAALKVCLCRYTGSKRIAVATPSRQGVGNGAGANVVVMVDDLDDGLSFQQLLLKVRETLQVGYSRQRYRYHKLLHDLGHANGNNLSPLFSVAIEFNEIHDPMPSVGQDSTFSLRLEADRLAGAVTYDARRFSPDAVKRLVDHLLAVLSEGIKNPSCLLGRLSLLTDSEREQLARWNATSETFPGSDRRVHELIEEQVARTPDAVAVRFRGEDWSYRRLSDEADRVARRLRRTGVGPGSIVGVCLDRSAGLVASMLGVLKSGGAYLPLDVELPAARLAGMIEDARPTLILTEKKCRERLPEVDCPVLMAETLDETACGEEETSPPQWPHDADLAYVLFTSGSTGRPKGAGISQAGLVNRLLWMQQTYRLTSADTLLQKTPSSFDVSVWEFFWPLMAGAKLVVAEPGGHRDPAYLARLIAAEQVSVVHFVPSMLTAFLVEPAAANCRSLRMLAVGGEELSSQLRDRFFAVLPHCELFNRYGPTEAVINVTAHRCTKGGPTPVPIGRPLANTQVYVLDREMRLCPIGVPGELYLGGIGVARGYVNRPALTAEQFVPDPFSSVAGSRLYRTGDRCRWLASGEIEFLGRLDYQVKIRGQRIELGEIESTLRSRESVRDAVVVLRRGVDGDGRLVGYVVPSNGDESSLEEELRAYLRARLPSHMVPDRLMVLERLPLTPNGKIDRAALPEPSPASAGVYEEPATELERQVAAVWKEVLHLERVGRNDDFFALGGHSLLATQVAARLRTLAGGELPLRRVFESPTVAALAQLLAESSTRVTDDGPVLAPQPRTNSLPLSFAQQRLWFLNQLQPGNAFYNVAATLRMRGPLDRAALERSVEAFVDRHETLRTTFPNEDGRPRQEIAAHRAVPLEFADLSDFRAPDREGEVQRRATAAARMPFDLSTGPLLRLQLLRLSESEHVLLATLHHIIWDGWSAGVAAREFALLYERHRQGQATALPPLPVQYADYAIWQRDWLQGPRLQKQLDYWRERLAGLPPLELPTDRPRPVAMRNRGALWAVELPVELTASLRAMARQENATLFMALVAGWQALLTRLSGERDVSVGTAVANRRRQELEGVVGFFLNMLVLRVDTGNGLTGRELLARVREATLEAHEYQDAPFDRVVEAVNPARDLGRAPLFQTLLISVIAPLKGVVAGEMEVETAPVDLGTAIVDMQILLREWEGRLEGQVEYSTDLFDESTVVRWWGMYVRMLEALASNPDAKIDSWPWLANQERRQLLDEWNGTAGKLAGSEKCVHELVEAQVRRTPKAVAVRFRGENWTYSRLDEEADRVARRLHRAGVGVGSVVGVCLERSAGLVASLLGVLKSGGAYLPLDAEWPAARLAGMIEDARPLVILAEERCRERLPEVDCPVLLLESEDERDVGVLAETARARPSGSDLAYVIFTSGSTGRPKGAGNSHAGVANCLLWMQQTYQLTDADTVLQKTPSSFDVSVWEFFWPLMAGATLVVAEPGGHQDPAYLVQLVAAEQISVIHLVPSMLRAFLGDHSATDCRSLRLMLAIGEELPEQLRDEFFAVLPNCELANLYGPTEAAINVTAHRCRQGGPAPVPIGRPIANTQVHVLDAQMQLCPVGVPGELYLGGVCVARGYVNRPGLTAERFVPDPFSAEGGRLYRTGDRCRWLPSGEVEFLGRLDFQVKLRGQRIELGEIESALRSHSSVRETVVVLRRGGDGDGRLVGYVVPSHGDGEGVEEQLREYLRERLPVYMVPDRLVVLERLPLTASGKLDRSALPETVAALVAAYEEPATEMERQVAAVWKEVLVIERVGRHDDFFALGGHSLLATQVAARLRPLAKGDLPLRRVFESPTVAGLAQLLAEPRTSAPDDGPALVARPRTEALPLSFSQQRLWFLDQLQPGSALYNIPAAVRLRGPLDRSALEQSVRSLIRRHETLRTTFPSSDGNPRQQIARELPLLIAYADLSEWNAADKEAEMLRRAEIEARAPFDLINGPLIRLQLLRLDEEDHVVLLTLHHIIADGWSLGVFVSELAVQYEGYRRGQALVLPPLPVQYADYAVWQREWLQGPRLQKQLNYWTERLADVPPLDLPTDRPRPAVMSYQGATKSVELPTELIARLGTLAREEKATLFMVLLACWHALLARLSGERDVAVGTAVANRRRLEVEGLIGFFVNMLVVRVDTSGGLTGRELIGRVREATLGAYEHQDVPFERVVEAVNPARDLSRSPLCQTMLVLQNAPMKAEMPGGLSMEVVAVETGTAKVDLSVLLGEWEGRLEGQLEYSTDLFDESTVARWWQMYVRMLEAFANDPDARIDRWCWLSDAEREELVRWNATSTAMSGSELRIHELVEAQVRRTPDAVAVRFRREDWSYRRLNEEAERVARALRGAGVGVGSVVGVCLERSAGLVASLLGVLKSGGAYLPLDADLPSARLAGMIEDACPVAVLTEERCQERLPEVNCRTLLLEGLDKVECNPGEAGQRPSGSDLAYVIFTSGSTGRPKGAGNSHAGVVNCLLRMQQTYQLSAADMVVQKTPSSFDVSVWEFFWPLMAGAKLVVAEPRGHQDPAYLVRSIVAEQISVVHLVPSMLRAFLGDQSVSDCRSLRLMLAIGEELPPQLRDDFFDVLPDCELANLYGPTEAAINVTAHGCRPNGPIPVPIGRPIANAQVHVLDPQMQLCPVGVPGELYLGGIGVARGYVNRPGLTAERFVPDPFSAEGGRLYRTGDRCRWLPSGEVEFLGRLDFQVKIRGQRIELGEIEAALRSHPSVRDAVVVRRGADGDGRLVGYVVPNDGGAGGLEEELRGHVRELLPAHMVPDRVMVLERLPLNSSGKLDRSALPEPGSALTMAYEEPANESERQIAAVWKEVLGVERVGRHDDFFALGGHSLLATQVAARLRLLAKGDLPLRRVFESPTVAALAQLLAEPSESVADDGPVLAPQPRTESLPLSFAQQRLWFLDQLQPGSAFYNIRAAVRLRGPLDYRALEQSLQTLIDRHETLRTTFPTVDGQPRQQIAAHRPLSLAVTDLSNLPTSDLEADVRQQAESEARASFDLSAGLLVRVKLLRLGGQEHVVLLTLHHIIADGWSLGVFVSELALLYEGNRRGQAAELPPLPVQYADYAVWQREWLQGPRLQKQLNYWTERLADVPPLDLPTDRPRPAVMSYQGATKSVELPTELIARLGTLAREEKATLFMVLLACWHALLARLSGERDVAVGTAVANRRRLEVEGLIGFFVNMLVVRVDASGGLTGRELIGRVREATLGAYEHQDVPFEQVVEAVNPARDLSRSPLFQTMLVLQNAPMKAEVPGGLAMELVAVQTGTAKVDLSVLLGEWDGALRGQLEYSTDLFDELTVLRWWGMYVQVLEALADNPDSRIDRWPLLNEAERQKLLRTWNHTEFGRPADSRVHRLFEIQATRAPDAMAVKYQSQQLSYEQLNAQANRLAHLLRQQGVDPEDRVAICLDRSPSLVVAVLAILKAGGAYVPLDPEQPQARLAFLLDDAGARMILTQSAWRSKLPESAVVAFDLDALDLDGYPADNLDLPVHPEQIAYVLHTSGSTGQPKGVMLPHRAVANYLQWAMKEYRLGPGRTAPVHSPVTFDLTVTSLWGPLISGGTVHLLANDVAALAEVLDKHPRYAMLKLTPAHLTWLTDAPVGDLAELLVVGGEALRGEHLKAWRRQSPEVRVVNEYGPTEAAVGCCVFEVPPGEVAAGPVLIGRPIGNARLYVLDEEGEPVTVGTPGELYIGGVGLARGYQGRASLTAERFVPDPFSGESGSRLYRSGDRCRWRADGQLEFLGRVDRQLKLRGYRIEPGEVEAVLLAHGAVREAVVVLLRDRTDDDVALVAYVVLHPGQEVTAPTLRSYLQERLPGYMLPGHIVVLESLPLTVHGKLDRKALPLPEREQSTAPYEEPANEMERRIAAVWKEVLGVERVGRHDDFFALGGHSLLATQVAARLRPLAKGDLPLRRVFESPTVAGLAQLLAEPRTSAPDDGPALVARPRTEALPLSFSQQRLWFLDQLQPGSALYNIPAAVRLRGPLDRSALEQSVRSLIRRHETLRTTFPSSDGNPRQQIARELPLLIAYADLSEWNAADKEAEMLRRAEIEARAPFDLINGPLIRLQLLRLDEEDHVVLLTLHHIIADGWSLGVFVSELAVQYEGYRRGQALVLPPLPVQYADYAVWQREWLQGPRLQKQLNYWTERLADVPPLDLPTDRPRPAVMSYQGATKSVELPTELIARLGTLAREEKATLFMVLLACWHALLARLSGERDVAVGTAVANRRRLEVEGLIGFFVNMLVVRVDTSGGLTGRELIGRVREATLGAYEHQDVPFERVVEAVNPARDLSRSPLCQTMLVLQNAPMKAEMPGGLSMEVVAVETGTAKVDLSVLLGEWEGRLEGQLEYSTDLFDESTVARWWQMYVRMLEAFANDPDARIDRWCWLSDAEREELVRWNATSTAMSGSELRIHELVEAQVRRTPDAVAVRFRREDWSYRRLNEEAERVARALRGAGVGVGSVVGVCLERSAGLVASLLGVLKSGGAYLPLDADLPSARLAGMIEDACPVAVLTEERCQERLPEVNCRTLLLEGLDKVECNPGEAGQRPSGSDLAYVIFTSGSTGRPKGAGNSHAGVVNCLLWMQQTYQLTDADTVLQKTPSSFDVSVWEFFWPLMAGAKLVVAEPRGHQDPAYLVRSIVAEQISVVHLVPSMLRAFLGDQSVSDCRSLRLMLAIGEELPPQLRDDFFDVLPDCELANLYGPTEAAINVTAHGCRPNGPIPVPIGRPIANAQVHVLDPQMQLCPVGVPGELYLGGIGVARGYVNRPGLTAERFVPDPFSAEGGRLYRTGDRCRWLPSGEVEFLGRLDFQVKIRGQRIELGEIEAALRSHPSVRDAVVVVRRGADGDGRLVGYVVPNDGGEGGLEEELRGHVRELLPAYMVPDRVMVLKGLPLTASGKLDRSALPEPGSALTMAYEEPANESERQIAAVWKEVLGVERVGRHDDFFALGGHSLLATQVAARLRPMARGELPLRRVFESPTVAALAKLLAEPNVGAMDDGPALVPQPRTESLPLSFSQQRLWFLEQLQPGSALYNIPAAMRLRGPLERTALEQSVQALIQRHESLRTKFPTVDGEPRQRIANELPLAMTIVDLSDLAAEDQEGRVPSLAEAEARAPFDLTNGPLIRLQLLRLSDMDHVVLLSLHHIIADGWSLGVFVSELALLYEGNRRGRAVSLPSLAVQYADYAVWQRQWLQGSRLKKQLEYWTKRLSNLALLELPTDRPRPAIMSYKGAKLSVDLPSTLTKRLQALAHEEKATLFMVLLAGWQALLARLSGERDVTVGTAVANRRRQELEGLIGFFVNMLVVRVDAGGELTGRELLRRVREATLEAYEHQDVPFEQLVEAVNPPRDLSRSPLFQTMLILQNAPLKAVLPSGLEMEAVDVDTGTTKVDISVLLTEWEGGLRASVEYSTDLFDAATVQRLWGRYKHLLELLASRPDAPMERWPWLTELERQNLLYAWNDTAVAGLGARTVHSLFEAQAAANPNLVAVNYGSEEISYGRLNELSNRLAHLLFDRGIGFEDRVGLCLERSPTMLVALLAILKAGAAYVPLDPEQPPARLAFLLQDTGARLVLTQSAWRSKLTESTTSVLDLEAVCLDELPDGNMGLPVNPEQIAYILYTSGSTGKPKGVMLPHRAVANYLQWAAKEYQLGPGRIVPVHSPVTFDLTVTSLLGPLVAGGTVHLLGNDVAALAEVLEKHPNYAMVKLTPAHLAWLADAAVPDLSALFVVGGEALKGEHLRAWRDQAPTLRVVNEYGPTEAAVGCCVFEVPAGKVEAGSLPIGRPIANARLYVLDELGEPVSVGAAGELYIGGMGLARGYYGHSALTAERFVPDPFSGDFGARLYRSGDRCRWRSDGQLEFLGRLDRQLKLRGYRIEPGEVESALLTHSEVREAAVVLLRDKSDDSALAAYVVPRLGQQTTPQEFRRFLQERLPAYLVPGHIVLLESLPLTAHGKLDTMSLPIPDRERPVVPYEEPATELERRLASVWSAVLGVERVGRHDNFFELGGHSLLATQLAGKLSAEFNRMVPVRALFQYPTIAGLAQAAASVATFAPNPIPARPISAPREPVVSDHAWQIERRPLMSLLAAGKIPPIQAAALCYFPVELLARTGLEASQITDGWCQGLPVLAQITETPAGRIGMFYLPRFESQLFADRDELVGVILDAIRMARQCGVKSVSLTSALPAATDQGRAVVSALGSESDVTVTTGHATTAAGVVLGLQAILAAAKRQLSEETIAIFGLGAMGCAVLRLILEQPNRPARIAVCDPYQSVKALERLLEEITTEASYKHPVEILDADAWSKRLGEQRLIVAASNVGDAIQVSQLAPGTVLVDGSSPPIFDVSAALARANERADILFARGGFLRAPQPLGGLIHVPPGADAFVPALHANLGDVDSQMVTTCVISSALSAAPRLLSHSIGDVRKSDAQEHLRALLELRLEAAICPGRGIQWSRAIVSRFNQST